MYRGVLFMVSLLLPTMGSHKVAVNVKQGEILGTREATVFERRLYYAFYGVPYAQPPTGILRFRNPKAHESWKPYSFDGRTEHHGACAQAHIVHKHALYGQEDCLCLNIYTPSLPKNGNEIMKPVIVWVHGYAFTSSFSHIYGADFLIDNDVLFITVSHRIGVFGFLKVNETDSNVNMGLRDVVMALKWIRRNVKEFGGDKTKVTVMGSSSGATFLSLLLTTNKRKLFSKMILQSGSIFSPSIFQGNHDLERARLREELQNIVKKDVKKAPAKDVVMASQKIYSNKEMINFQKSVIPFSPIIEEKSKKSLITTKPEDFYTNAKNLDIPILIGFTSQESISEVIPFLNNPRYLTSLAPFFKFMVPFTDGCKYNYTSNSYKAISGKIKKHYFKDGITENSIENFLKYASDLLKFPVYKFIKSLLSINKNKMYVYKFNYVGSFNAVKATSVAGARVKVKGAASGDEICYVLKCEPLWQSYVKIDNDTSNRDRELIKRMASLWANFAKHGDPTPPTYTGGVRWLPMTSKEDNMLLIGKEIKLVGTKVEQRMFKFWNEIYDSYYSYEHCIKHMHDEF